MFVFIPDFVSMFFSHLAMVQDATALWGFITAINTRDSSPLNFLVRSSWTEVVVSREAWKEEVCHGFNCLV